MVRKVNSKSGEGRTTLISPPESPMSIENINKTYQYKKVEGQWKEKFHWTKDCEKDWILNFLPILQWLPKYDWRKNLVDDLAAGITGSVLQIPHGLALAPLGGQEPVKGLYMAVFPIMMYVILGTSRHISLGMMGILIMMVGKVVDTYSSVHMSADNGTLITPDYTAVEVCIAVTFMMGFWQFLLSCLQLGFLCVLLSDCLISGLTAGAAIHIVYLQIKNLLGIPLVISSTPLKLFYATESIIKLIPMTKIPELILSISFMTLLIAYNRFARKRLRKLCRIPLPIEFILVFLAIGLSEALDLSNRYGVAVVGEVPEGLPIPMVPPFALMPKILIDTFILALINISFNISLAKLFAKKGGYEIRQNQELFAYGASNIFGSFFQSLPVSASFSRTAVQFEVGGKTELIHLISLLSVLFILLGFGFLFAKIPLSVLAAIVIVTVKGLLMQITEFPKYWRKSKLDGGVWMITFITAIVVDIDYAIGIGLLASILSLIILGVENQVQVLGRIPGKNYFVCPQNFPQAEQKSNVLILKLSGALNFCNAASVTRQIEASLMTLWLSQPERATCVILDFRAVPSVDPSTVEQFSFLRKSCKQNNCTLLFAHCNVSIYNTFKVCRFFENFPPENVIMTIEDALKYIDTAKLIEGS